MPNTATANPAPVMFLMNPPEEARRKIMPKTSARVSGKTKGARSGTRSGAASNPISAKEIVTAIQKTEPAPVAKIVKKKNPGSARGNPIFPGAGTAVNLLVKGGFAAAGAVITEFVSQLALPNLDSTKVGAILKRVGATFIVHWIADRISPFAAEYLLIGGMSNAAGILVVPYTQQFLTSTQETLLPADNGVAGLGGLYRFKDINGGAELEPSDNPDLGGLYPMNSINSAASLNSHPDGSMV